MKAIVVSLALLFFMGCACNQVVKDEPVKSVRTVSTVDHTYCEKCGGLGLVKCTVCDGYGISGDCFACKGTGKQGTLRCLVCHGTGNSKCWSCKGFGIKKCTNEVSEGAITSGLTDALSNMLLETGKFTVVERKKMAELMNEQKLQLTGCTSDECAVEIGKILNVNYMVAGSLVKIGSEFVVNVRFISVESSEVIYSGMEKAENDREILPAVKKIATESSGKLEKIIPGKKSVAVLYFEAR